MIRRHSFVASVSSLSGGLESSLCSVNQSLLTFHLRYPEEMKRGDVLDGVARCLFENEIVFLESPTATLDLT